MAYLKMIFGSLAFAVIGDMIAMKYYHRMVPHSPGASPKLKEVCPSSATPPIDSQKCSAISQTNARLP